MGATLDGDLPSVIFDGYHDEPTDMHDDGDGVDLLAKIATEVVGEESLMTYRIEEDEENVFEKPEMAQKIATEELGGDTHMTDVFEKDDAGQKQTLSEKPSDEETGFEEPKLAEKFVSDVEKQTDNEDMSLVGEKGKGSGEKGKETEEQEESGGEKQTHGESGGDTSQKEKKTRPTYSDLRKPPFEPKNLRSSRNV